MKRALMFRNSILTCCKRLKNLNKKAMLPQNKDNAFTANRKIRNRYGFESMTSLEENDVKA
jgi:hypothetical protein